MNIALLIDAENTQPQKMDAIFKLLSERGNVPIRRAYGNWSKEALKSWQPVTKRLGIKQEQQPDYVADKNATDIALVIAALDLLHKGSYDAFALVSSDSDFTPLAIYLREAGVEVLGFGKANAPTGFRASCTHFTELEGLEPLTPPRVPLAPTVVVSRPTTPMAPVLPKPLYDLPEEELHATLSIATDGEPGTTYTDLTTAANLLHDLHPQRRLSYAGHSKLLCFLADHPERYELTRKNKVARYRLRLPAEPAAPATLPTPGPTSVPARLHIWLREISESSNTEDGFATMGHAGHHLHKLAREAGFEFNIKDYGFSKLINLFRAFPKLYEVREEKHNGTTVYAYRRIGGSVSNSLNDDFQQIGEPH